LRNEPAWLLSGFVGSDNFLSVGSGTRSAEVDFASFYREQYRALVAFFVRRVEDRELARDLTAEAFRIAWSRWDTGAAVSRAWLFGVAHNLVGDEWRRRARSGPIEELPETLQAPDRQRDAEVRLLLEAMSPTERHVLVLTYWDGLSAAEVAAALGISRANVWTRLTRARRAFLHAWHEPPELTSSHVTRPSRHPSEEPL
jgi:RNA polymerase sigma-70 factor (ECF subfamily)